MTEQISPPRKRIFQRETVAAVATPPGRGSVGIVRISGAGATNIAAALLGQIPPSRVATLCTFLGADGTSIDKGIVLFFPSPRSFTGEDVLELQGHGSPVVLDMLLRRCVQLGARLARPGEFSERAFLNGKLDLVQVEAVADLIESATETAARLATRSLEGEFSRRIESLAEGMRNLRVSLEAALDFPDETIDVFEGPQIAVDLSRLIADGNLLLTTATQGCLIYEGRRLVIAGPPNAGKSSLFNALLGRSAAIVTDVAGTTRDVLAESIQIDGMPFRVLDTAGLRELSADPIEQEGVRRAKAQIEQADHILWVFDDSAAPCCQGVADTLSFPKGIVLTIVRNKIDLTGNPPGKTETDVGVEIAVSARTGVGLDELRAHIKGTCGYRGDGEPEFMARRRHLDALERALRGLNAAVNTLSNTGALELVAEDIRQSHRALGEITGEVSSDELLGHIFSSFCIGK